MRARRGFTLAEVMISLVVSGVIGASFMRLLVSQNRYYDHETNMRTARSIARSASTILVADLRMVQDSGGVDSVTSDGKVMRVLVPYRFGLVCGTSGNVTTVSMLPIDSGTMAGSVYRGFAWRVPATGRYTYVSPDSATARDLPTTSANPARCTGAGAGQAQVRTVSVNGRVGALLDLPGPAPSGAPATVPVFFWQRITYTFRASVIYPNKVGLWRIVEGGPTEELMAPFDTSARFRFYQAGDDTSRTWPPPVNAIRGVDLVLTALSPRATSKDSTGSQSKVVTAVFFKNVRAF
jgi:prepilin-type N-terminal cleavage/methylation domain-containing protein